LDILHFDQAGVDLGHAPEAREACELACYDCLLTYQNQRHHALLDRHSVRKLLLTLASAIVRQSSEGTVPDGPAVGAAGSTSAGPLADAFQIWLAQGGYRLPDRVDVVHSDAGTIHYLYQLDSGPVAVLDDDRDRQRELADRLEDAGWTVLRLTARSWAQTVAQFPSVFGTGAR
jgi:hypothetical protein